MLIDNIKDYNQISGVDTKNTARAIASMMGKDCGRDGDMDIVTGFFTIKGINFIQEIMADETKFRMVLSKMAGYSPEDEGKCAIDLLSEDNSIASMLTLSEDAKKAVEFLSRDNISIRAISNAFCHAKSYIFKDKNQPAFDSYLTGSSNLTEAGLGIVPTSNVELNVAEMGHTDTFKSHRDWFNELWKYNKDNEIVLSDPKNPKSEKITVKQYFINLITDTILRTYTPEDIYYKILFEYFKADIDIESQEMQKDIKLLQNTIIYKETLFDYQQKGVISLIQMLEKYEGAILADAVGLGKTFSALAVMWYFQNKGYTVAVFCPKKLQQNWEQYQEFSNSRFEKDRFHFVVNFHTDLQGDRLSRKEKGSLAYLQSQNKLLIVIDESHNLRNSDSERYKMLLNDVIARDDDKRIVKVLQLSATPINNKLTDVRNQFNLIGHGRNDYFDAEFEIESLKALFQDAQKKYKSWTFQKDRTIGGLIKKLPTKFFNLTDRLIVARTRKMVEQTTNSNLGFPIQKEPRNIFKGINRLGNYKTFKEIYDGLLASNLTAYKPSMYMGYINTKDWQDDAYREASLVRMMATLFTKRLESSWYACFTTIEKVLQVHKETLRRVNAFIDEHGAPVLIYKPDDVLTDDDEEEIDYDVKTSLDKGRIDLAQMKEIDKFKADLEYDIEKLQEFYDNIVLYKEQFESGKTNDIKLDILKQIIIDKQNEPNKKLVIFTAFTDTAEYLYRELSKDPALKCKMACVSGSRTLTPEGSTKLFGQVLQRFAPKSKLYKEKDWTGFYARKNDEFYNQHYNAETNKWNVSYDEWKGLLNEFSQSDYELLNNEIDILIATDCLSEGQNLQDADLVVNYDIHWNPVRLIQRFGRIDRIGSENKYIGSVNFWPAEDYDGVLNLATRINNRMTAMALVGSETLPVSDKIKEMLADNPIIDENTQKLLEQMKKNISDIEQPQTVSLANLSLETFRQDLLEFLRSKKDFFLTMPIGAYSGFEVESNMFEDIPESLVALVGYPHRTPNDKDKRYENLYLLCQPVEKGAKTHIEEVNVAQTLEFLRNNKKRDTFLPEWIEKPNKERIDKLSGILKEWMKERMTKDAYISVQNPRKFLANLKAGVPTTKLDEKFHLENFDLIVWEYVSKSQEE